MSLAGRTEDHVIVTAGFTLALAMLACGCGRDQDPPAQSATAPSGTAATPSQPAPVLGPPPVLTSISTNVGSTEGGVLIWVDGTGFTNVTLTIAGVRAYSGPVAYPTSFLTAAPPGVAGPADVVLTNADGQSSTLKNGFTYLPPSSFDFNGDWGGMTGWVHELQMSFSIRNNTLVSASCGGSPNLVPTPVPVVNGSFSVTADNSFSGRIVGVGAASGSISGPSVCGSDSWRAGR
jgi:hypothetical protein